MYVLNPSTNKTTNGAYILFRREDNYATVPYGRFFRKADQGKLHRGAKIYRIKQTSLAKSREAGKQNGPESREA